MQQAADQNTESDQQPDLGHDVAEADRDALNGAFEADARGQPQVQRTDHQRDHRVDLEPDDQDHHKQNRDYRVKSDH